jgi:hypothetical protein
MVFIGLIDQKYTDPLLYLNLVAALEVALHIKINQTSNISVAMQHMDEVYRHVGAQRKKPDVLNSTRNSPLCLVIATHDWVQIVALVMGPRPDAGSMPSGKVGQITAEHNSAMPISSITSFWRFCGLMSLVYSGLRV